MPALTAALDAGRVYVNVGLPHCQGQGIGAICGRAALDHPTTVHHPVRACALDSGSKLVMLDVPDSMQIPPQIAMHHREGGGGGAPERTTFEGDNMLLVPCFRCGTSGHLPHCSNWRIAHGDASWHTCTSSTRMARRVMCELVLGALGCLL